MKHINLLIFSLFIFISNLLGQYNYPDPHQFKQMGFDVIHYDATIDLTKAFSDSISGVSNITIVVTDTTIDKYFYFNIKVPPDSVLFDGIRVPVSIVDPIPNDCRYFLIDLGDSRVGDTHTISIYFRTKVKNEGYPYFGGVHRTSAAVFSVGVGMKEPCVATTHYWLPCFDHPSDKATFSIKFITLPNHLLATNGRVRKIGQTQDGNSIWEAISNHPIATYLLTFAVGEFEIVRPNYELLPESVDLEIYCSKQDKVSCEKYFENFYKVFYYFQQLFGAYPFEKVGFVVVPFNAGAMEHQTMITMPSSYVQRINQAKDSIQYYTLVNLAAHEFSHQWFGNSVTPKDFRDVWFNEGFASFSEALFLGNFLGNDFYLSHLREFRKSFYSGNETNYPLYNFQQYYKQSNYPLLIYTKGAIVAGLLRFYLGEERYSNLIREFLSTRRYGSFEIHDFISFCNNYLDEDISWFFEQWVFGRGYPTLAIDVNLFEKEGNLCDVLLNIKQIPIDFQNTYLNLPIEFSFKTKDGKYLDTVLSISNEDTIIILQSLPTFDSLIVNRGVKVVSLAKTFLNLKAETSSRNVSGNIFAQIFSTDSNVILNLIEECDKLELIFFDILGRKVFETCVESNTKVVSLDLGFLSKGIYFAKISCNRGFQNAMINLH